MPKKLIDKRTYTLLYKEIKQAIQQARLNAAYTLNKEQVLLNFTIGRCIVEKQITEEWGKSIVEKLAIDLQNEFKGLAGFSPQNLWFMRQFFLEYEHEAILLRLATLIPWGQNIVIIRKIKKKDERKYYLKATSQMGWSRNVLLNQIKANAFIRH